MITNAAAGTNIHGIAAGIFRINRRGDSRRPQFNFNRYLLAGDEALLFQTAEDVPAGCPGVRYAHAVREAALRGFFALRGRGMRAR